MRKSVQILMNRNIHSIRKLFKGNTGMWCSIWFNIKTSSTFQFVHCLETTTLHQYADDTQVCISFKSDNKYEADGKMTYL